MNNMDVSIKLDGHLKENFMKYSITGVRQMFSQVDHKFVIRIKLIHYINNEIKHSGIWHKVEGVSSCQEN
jgi:hypothetical protein